MTITTALELYFEESVKHFDFTDAQLAKRIAKCQHVMATGSVIDAGLARNIGGHALELLRSRLACAGVQA